MNLTKEILDTKEKIMTVAFELFGRYGVEGTSIRQIAQQSDVNIAALNYHFKSKENLYWEIMARTYTELDAEIKAYSETSKSTVDLAMKTFDHFREERIAVMNVMKMMLSEKMPLPQEPELQKVLMNPMGPPGGQYFADWIQKDTKKNLKREQLLWGIKAIFGTVFHWGIMCASSCMIEERDPLFTPEQIRKDVKKMVEVFMKSLD